MISSYGNTPVLHVSHRILSNPGRHRLDLGGQACSFGSFPAKSPITSKEVKNLSHCLAVFFWALLHYNLMTILVLLHTLSNGVREREEI